MILRGTSNEVDSNGELSEILGEIYSILKELYRAWNIVTINHLCGNILTL